jgi:protease I
MELEGKKVAIPIETMYNEFEFWYPYYRLKEAGAEVVVVGIVIPGGYAPDHMRRYPSMVNLVKDIFEQGKVVAAICHAGWMLASAEVVQGRKLTSFFAIKDDLIHAGGNWVDEEVVIDGNLVTSRTPNDLPAFMRAVIASLKG